MGHRTYESFVLLPLKLCVKFEWSIIEDRKKILKNCEITNSVTRADHVHFVAVQCTKRVWSACETKNLGGHVTGTAPFRKIFKVTPVLSLEARMSNLKSVALTILELLAFNAQKFRGSHDPGYAPCSKNF